ncbi:MAG: hypothetical protein LBP19_05240 [Treponema sp.]|jgi:hypothetical protein|nr:hypothetical protein [Treponema sp.]
MKKFIFLCFFVAFGLTVSAQETIDVSVFTQEEIAVFKYLNYVLDAEVAIPLALNAAPKSEPPLAWFVGNEMSIADPICTKRNFSFHPDNVYVNGTEEVRTMLSDITLKLFSLLILEDTPRWMLEMAYMSHEAGVLDEVIATTEKLRDDIKAQREAVQSYRDSLPE